MSNVKKVFVWENFGPGHDDRCAIVAKRLGEKNSVVGLEIFSNSSTYDWVNKESFDFVKRTVFVGKTVENVSFLTRAYKTFFACIKYRKADIFMCHYENPATLIVAILLRMCGARVYVMNDSKFDDYKRTLGKENLKYLFYFPYCGALSSGSRSKDYLRFLGVKESKIEITYNTLSIDRLRKNANQKAGEKTKFNEREFTIIARLVEKKNLFVSIDAYAKYVRATNTPRRLNIAGSGHLEKSLKIYADELEISHLITWHGFLQTEDISNLLNRSLALILLSTEEQFGNVVIEAQALDLPCIVSTAVGARDHLIKTGVTGFIVEPENPEGAAYFMRLIAENEALWSHMSAEVRKIAPLGDVERFWTAVKHLSG